MQKLLPVSLVLSLALSLASGPVVAQSTWYVDVNGTAPGSGTQLDPYTRIQYAIDQAATAMGDTLLVLPGTYLETIDTGPKWTLNLRSSAGPELTIIDAQGAGSALNLTGSSQVDGFTLTGGLAERGGGVRCDDTIYQATLRDCHILNNRGTYGGGIGSNPLASAYLLLDSCRIENNFASQFGGGLCVIGSFGLAQVRDCTFEGNAAERGGGIFVAVDPTVDVLDSNFIDNYATGDGGAVCAADDGDYDQTGGLFFGNHADGKGGGMWAESNFGFGTSVWVRFVTFHKNSTQRGGASYRGAIPIGVGFSRFNDCEFYDNSAVLSGGALCGENYATNSFFSGNLASNGGAMFLAPGPKNPVIIQACEMRANHATGTTPGEGRGGAVWGIGTLVDSVLVGNTALEGGAVYRTDLDHCSLTLNSATGGGAAVEGAGHTSVNSIAWGNSPAGYAAGLNVTWSDIQGGYAGTGNIDLDPLFWLPVSGDVMLRTGSPAIGSGEGGSTMGAHEFSAAYCSAGRAYCSAKEASIGCVPMISGQGTPTLSGADVFHINAAEIVSGRLGLMFWGHGAAALPFLGGTLCVQAPLIRTGLQVSGGTPGSDCSGTFDWHFDQAGMSAAGLGASDLLYAQYWYRDPAHPDGTGVGMSDGFEFRICP